MVLNQKSLTGFEKTIQDLEALGEIYYLEPATEKQICDFETNTGILFPKAIKEWLQISDGGEFFPPASFQLYGVAHKPLIDVNDNDRPSKHYTVIGRIPNGDPVLCENNSDQISIFNHEAGRIENDETFSDFKEFLISLPEILGIG